MDIQQLRAFREVARQRSFSGAAKELFLSQPAVSRQVASLESEIGMPLFVRVGNCTSPGRKLLKYAEDILFSLEQAQRTVQDLQDLQKGTVTVAADAYLSKYFLPHFIKEFHYRYPGLQLRLITRNQEELPSLLATGQCDLGFLCGELDNPSSLILEQLCTENLFFVTQGQLSPDISENIKIHTPFLFPPKLSSFGEEYKKLLPEDIAREESPITLESLEGIKTTLLSGLGCSILPENIIRLESQNGHLNALPTGLECPVVLIYPKDVQLPNPVSLFMDFVRKSLLTSG